MKMDVNSTKRILHPGRGDLMELLDGYKVIFDYRVQLFDDDKTCIDDSKKSYPDGYGRPMELILGKKFKLPIWETCLRTMRVDEIASFIIPPKDLLDYPFVSQHLRDISKKSKFPNAEDEHMHRHSCMGMAAARGSTGIGYPQLDQWLVKPEPLMFTFHVVKILNSDDYEHESWTLDSNQKLASVPVLREEGNNFFKEGRFVDACARYCEALSRLDTLLLAEKPGDPDWVALDIQKVPLYTNLAQCKLNLHEFYLAIEAADEALKRDPDNVKALYRRAKAHACAWNFDLARSDYDRVKNLDNSMTNVVVKELEQLKAVEKEKNSNDASRFQNLFSK